MPTLALEPEVESSPCTSLREATVKEVFPLVPACINFDIYEDGVDEGTQTDSCYDEPAHGQTQNTLSREEHHDEQQLCIHNVWLKYCHRSAV